MESKRFPALRLAFLVMLLALAGCSSDRRLPLEVTTPSPAPHGQPATAAESDSLHDDPTVSPLLQSMNQRLEQMGLNFRVTKAEFVTGFDGTHLGNTIIDNDRNKQLGGQYVPFDVRRNADGRNITYLVDLSDATPNGGLTSAQTEAAIDRAMATWNAVTCANIPIVKRPDPGVDPDVADGLLGFGTVGTPHYADIVHAGWMPPAFFDAIFPGGGNYILGITFGFRLFDPPTGDDINHDHMIDVSFAEIYYNNHFAWGINADPPIADVETVALHEAGHGLNQGHFGKIFIKNDPNGNHMGDPGDAEIQFAPFAVMNATIFGQNHVLQGTDIAGHCSLWGSWPNQ